MRPLVYDKVSVVWPFSYVSGIGMNDVEDGMIAVSGAVDGTGVCFGRVRLVRYRSNGVVT